MLSGYNRNFFFLHSHPFLLHSSLPPPFSLFLLPSSPSPLPCTKDRDEHIIPSLQTLFSLVLTPALAFSSVISYSPCPFLMSQVPCLSFPQFILLYGSLPPLVALIICFIVILNFHLCILCTRHHAFMQVCVVCTAYSPIPPFSLPFTLPTKTCDNTHPINTPFDSQDIFMPIHMSCFHT